MRSPRIVGDLQRECAPRRFSRAKEMPFSVMREMSKISNGNSIEFSISPSLSRVLYMRASRWQPLAVRATVDRNCVRLLFVVAARNCRLPTRFKGIKPRSRSEMLTIECVSFVYSLVSAPRSASSSAPIPPDSKYPDSVISQMRPRVQPVAPEKDPVRSN